MTGGCAVGTALQGDSAGKRAEEKGGHCHTPWGNGILNSLELGRIAREETKHSGEFIETPEDGMPYTTQYFERARFALHPENAGMSYNVLFGSFGRRLFVGARARNCHALPTGDGLAAIR